MSDVMQIIDRQHRRLLAADKRVLAQLVQGWQTVERGLRSQVNLLASVGATLKGKPPSLSQLQQMKRYNDLMKQVREQIATYSLTATQLTKAAQKGAISGADADARQVLQLYGVGTAFNKISVDAVNAAIGLTAQGAPLYRLFKRTWALSADAMSEAFLTGVAGGWSTTKIAKELNKSTLSSLQRMLTIARTETLRVYRIASIKSYQASGVVHQQRRLAAKSIRTCMACLADDGTLYPISSPIPDHPNGRCTGVPVIDGRPTPRFTQGKVWFEKQSDDTQQGMMGRVFWEAWKKGFFTLDDLITRTYHPTWGAGIQVTPLGELI